MAELEGSQSAFTWRSVLDKLGNYFLRQIANSSAQGGLKQRNLSK